MSKPFPIPLRKPSGKSRSQIVQLYEDETVYGVAQTDTSIVKTLNDVSPQTSFPTNNFSFNIGGLLNSAVQQAAMAVQDIGSAIAGAGQSMTGGGSGGDGDGIRRLSSGSTADAYGDPPSI